MLSPPIGELPYLLTLPGHGFYWFQLPPVPEEQPLVSPVTAITAVLPEVGAAGDAAPATVQRS